MNMHHVEDTGFLLTEGESDSNRKAILQGLTVS